MGWRQPTQVLQKVTDFSEFWVGGVIGPYFFENDIGE